MPKVKEIPLTRGQVALVSPEDYKHLSQWKWYALKSQYGFYATRAKYYTENGEKKRDFLYMHRVVMGVSVFNIKVDHKDHNGLNNQRSNLRIANDSQNCANRSSEYNSTSKYLGVHWESGINKWRVQIRVNGATKHIGVYVDEIEAALAYNKAAVAVHGEFANLNIIP